VLGEHTLHFIEKIVDQSLRVLERIWPAGILLRAVPVIRRIRPLLAPARRRNRMGVIETNEPRVVRTVERERVPQPMRPFARRLDANDFKLKPVPASVPMGPSVKGKQKLQRMVGGFYGRFLSYPHRIILS
jgi:hypothetical protein